MVNGKECTLNTGELPPEDLPRNSVVRITVVRIAGRPNMASATNQFKLNVQDIGMNDWKALLKVHVIK